MANFYNKYRPRKFSEVIGQGQSIDILRRQTQSGQFHHAYLMYGASGTGKTSTARILAMALNCNERDGTGDPCGQCPSCRAVIEGRHWDILEIDGAQFTGIDTIRDLKYKAYLCPLSNKKVYIIDEAHRLSEQAWDGMLKLLEEPPPHLVIILCSTQPDRIPLTVKSRTQCYPFHSLKPAEVRAKLERIAKTEGIEPEPRHIDFIIECAGGNIRSAENLLEQVVGGKCQ